MKMMTTNWKASHTAAATMTIFANKIQRGENVVSIVTSLTLTLTTGERTTTRPSERRCGRSGRGHHRNPDHTVVDKYGLATIPTKSVDHLRRLGGPPLMADENLLPDC